MQFGSFIFVQSWIGVLTTKISNKVVSNNVRLFEGKSTVVNKIVNYLVITEQFDFLLSEGAVVLILNTR